jgi:hypothetical protein
MDIRGLQSCFLDESEPWVHLLIAVFFLEILRLAIFIGIIVFENCLTEASIDMVMNAEG